MKWLEQIWVVAKRALSILGVFAFIVIGIAIGRLSSCEDKQAEKHVGIAVEDSLIALELVREDNKNLRGEKTGLFSRVEELLGLVKRPQATGTVSRVDPMPGIDTVITRIVRGTVSKTDTVHHYWVSPIDVPITVVANSDEVRITTRNSYNATNNQPFSKIYRWSRYRKDFSFHLNETVNWNKLDGITIHFITRTFEWNGFAALIGIAFPQGPYGGVDAKMTFWEFFELSPRAVIYPNFPSSTTFAVEARLRF